MISRASTTPTAVATDLAGNIYVADSGNHLIRKISPAGAVTTLAGQAGVSGTADGTGNAAHFAYPMGIVVDSSGVVFVADSWNHTIRSVSPEGAVTTLAGLGGAAGLVDGQGISARFAFPMGLAVDAAGAIFVSDSANHTVRKVSPTGKVTTLVESSHKTGATNGDGVSTRFFSPSGIEVDAFGNLYVADTANNAIRKGTVRGSRSDFTGTAGSDLVWQNSSTGQRGLWIMDGASFAAWVDLGMVSAEWRIVGTADFNRDGSPDIVWENGLTGERGAWLMANATYSSWFSLGTLPTAWRIAQTGSSGAGDKTFLLWENTATGERYCWTYEGTTFTASTYLGVVSTEWKMVGMGDLNGDLLNDILWENSATGERGVWLLDANLSFTGWQALGFVPTEWHIAGLADYNADDMLDVLWENTTTGERLAWLLNGTTYVSTAPLGSAPSAWKVTN